MSSLSAHLRRVDSHAGLRFRPDCPTCRQERLVGLLPGNAIVAHRTLAALTAGLLAVSAGAPPLAAAAREPDQEQTGATDPGSSTDSARNPDTETGGPTTTPPDVPAAADPPGDSDKEPPEPEPTKDPAAEDASDQAATPQRHTGPATTQAPATSAAPAPAAASTPTIVALAPAGQASKTTLVPPRPQPLGKHGRQPKRGTQTAEPLGTSTPEIQTSLPALQAQPVVPVAEHSTPATTAIRRHTRGGARAARRARIHVVVAGESLWSIARDQLGRGASNTKIAREVHRLWQLNAKVIATGSPDLLPANTKLRLR